jgi:RimJ/RimL family protein N-acetyltransferase
LKAPERLVTERLILRRPAAADVEAIYTRYASDREVTRYLGWPRHEALEQTLAFLSFSDAEWDNWPAGPYLIESRKSGALLGGTGFGFQSATEAATGYVLARDAWGRGYATEALQALTVFAGAIGLRRMHALCHAEHVASQRVLEKCGFLLDSGPQHEADFPNLERTARRDALSYSRKF